MIALLLRLFPQDAQRRDWYGWLTNQLCHFVLGVGLAALISWAGLKLTGEYPVKWQAWLIAAIPYAWTEVARGGDWADALEDWIFVCLYGGAGAMAAFSEIDTGSPLLSVDLDAGMLVLSIMAAHLAVGCYTRRQDD